MGRGDLSAAEWELIGPLLPPERGRWARPARDNRRFLNGMLHVLRVGWPWRDMHERYGKWNSVYVRFRRWAEQGVWDALLQTLVDPGKIMRRILRKVAENDTGALGEISTLADPSVVEELIRGAQALLSMRG
jgi:transposase